MPIQAADLFAWCFRKATDDGGPIGFEWLLDEMKNVRGTDYSQYYDKDRMLSVQNMSHEFIKGGLVDDEVIRMYRETLKLVF